MPLQTQRASNGPPEAALKRVNIIFWYFCSVLIFNNSQWVIRPCTSVVLALCYDCKEFVLSLFICQVFFVLHFITRLMSNEKPIVTLLLKWPFLIIEFCLKRHSLPNLILSILGYSWFYFCPLQYNEDFPKKEKMIHYIARDKNKCSHNFERGSLKCLSTVAYLGRGVKIIKFVLT